MPIENENFKGEADDPWGVKWNLLHQVPGLDQQLDIDDNMMIYIYSHIVDNDIYTMNI